MKWKRLLKVIIFIIIFAILFSVASKVLIDREDIRNYQWIAGFYEEEENSLDAVYIGSSNCYAFWNPLVAWEQYGIAIYPYTSNAQPIIATEYLIKETRKTQPNAVFILNTNTIGEKMMESIRFHYLLDNMPFSLNKIQLTNYLASAADCSFSESLEFYFPLIRYHDRWFTFSANSFDFTLDGMKGVSAYSTYFKDCFDITDQYIMTEEAEPLPEFIAEAFHSLLDYCDAENINILFVTVPRAEESETIAKQINDLNALIRERGYTVLDLMKEPETVDADLTQDYYNEGHMNVHGAIKYTHYISKYLIANYGLEDKRGEAAYSSWDTAYEKYQPELYQYVLDLELDISHRDFSLPKPENLQAQTTTQGVDITWSAVEGAQGYAVYRKIDNGMWEAYKTTTEVILTDTAVESGKLYQYRIIPFYEKDGVCFYGNFSYEGVTGGAVE